MEINIISSVLFFVLAVLAVVSAAITVLHRQPVKSAISMVFHFFMLAGIYLTLSAQFLAIMQIIVYAGAIMVLVVFVVMLLNQGESAAYKSSSLKLLLSSILSGMFLFLVVLFINSNTSITKNSISTANNINMSPETGTIQAVGQELFTNFLVPIEITGVLLLAAIIGAVLLAKRRLV